MPKMSRALLQKISWGKNPKVVSSVDKFEVQFNPESLKVAFTNQIAGAKNKGTSGIQFASRGTTKLSFEMWFDVTAERSPKDDVRKLTQRVIAFMVVPDKKKKKKYTPPGCRFQWGSFVFEGVMESVNETLEFFSEDGKPLRARVSVSLVKHEVEVDLPKSGKRTTAGTQPRQPARQGDSVQAMSAREGRAEDWQKRAQEQGIEDPLRVAPGSSLPSGTSSGMC